MADSGADLLKTVESVLYLVLLHGDYSSLGALLKDVQDHNSKQAEQSA